MTQAENSLKAQKYAPAVGPFCEPDMTGPLRLDPQAEYQGVRLYFAEEQQARTFVDAYQPGVVGTAKVKLFCLD